MHRIYGIFATVAFTAVTLPTVLLVAVIPGQWRRRRLVKASATLLFRVIGAPPRVSGLDNLPAGACVAVANHASYLDGMILTAVLPPQFAFVIKREMTQVPFANFLLQRVGSEFIERFDRSQGATDARRILELAQRQESLAFFPEGTFRAEPGLRRFHNGAFAAARRGVLPVVPIIIRGSRGMLPAHCWFLKPGKLEVIVKSPVIHATEARSTADLMRESREAILADLDEPDLSIRRQT